ncbi:MAG: UvrD-helicase domain-containing protein, partial [Sphingomonadaceae bacterium]
MSGAFQRTPEQKLAADPARHIFVGASAGTGKTQVLTDRILRILLAGTPPERLLALTFTRAAAAEMRNRVTKRLAHWQGLDDAALDAELAALGLSDLAESRAKARLLFARVLDVPGGLVIQTLHGFAQGVLAAFPLEAGLPPGFRALDDRAATTLKREALSEAIADAQAEGDSGFLDDLGQLAVLKGEQGVLSALDRMIGHAAAFDHYNSGEALTQAVRRWLGVGADEQPGDRLRAAFAPEQFDEAALGALASNLRVWGTKTGLGQAEAIEAWLAADTEGRVAGFPALLRVVMTGDGTLRSFAHAERKAQGTLGLAETIFNQLTALAEAERAITTAVMAAAALRAGQRVAARYDGLKRAALAIDYDDMVRKAAALLGPAGRPGYVAWKLDSRFDQVLVDEAQDTNELQWHLIGRLVEDFFEPDPDASRGRRLFVVGDQKQAIYGFQGTDPRVLPRVAARLKPQAEAAASPLADVPLDHSFRSGPAVLAVVNALLDDLGPDALGLAAKPGAHVPHRASAPGEVVLWPVLTVDEEGDEDGAEGAREAADRAMAERLAATIAGWLQPGDTGRLWLPAHGRWARAGDILVLLRARSWLMGALVGRLAARRVPVAGVDRLLLTEPLAVLDLLALVRFATNPEDDLTLAQLLASPFLGWDQEALLRLAHGRRGDLWAALGGAAGTDVRAAEARGWLGEVLALADTVGPYRFLDTILSGPLEGRRRLLARLGPEANDPIDELLARALDFEAREAPGLAAFLHWVEAEASDVKREAEQGGDQVRLMTVHGAKGLEAPVVVLADAAQQARPRPEGWVPIELDGGAHVPLFHPSKPDCPAAVRAAMAARDQLAAEEDRRLLYVALTRAADHLFIGGAVGPKAAKKIGTDEDQSWHGVVGRAMDRIEGVESVQLPGWAAPARRLRIGAWSPPADIEAARVDPDSAAHDTAPGLHLGPAPPPGRPPRPLTPSALPDAPPAGPAGEALKLAARRGI